MPRLTKNAAYCRSCQTEIESKSRHDLVSCPCGALFVDGGLEYIRIGYETGAEWENRSEYSDA